MSPPALRPQLVGAGAGGSELRYNNLRRASEERTATPSGAHFCPSTHATVAPIRTPASCSHSRPLCDLILPLPPRWTRLPARLFAAPSRDAAERIVRQLSRFNSAPPPLSPRPPPTSPPLPPPTSPPPPSPCWYEPRGPLLLCRHRSCLSHRHLLWRRLLRRAYWLDASQQLELQPQSVLERQPKAYSSYWLENASRAVLFVSHTWSRGWRGTPLPTIIGD